MRRFLLLHCSTERLLKRAQMCARRDSDFKHDRRAYLNYRNCRTASSPWRPAHWDASRHQRLHLAFSRGSWPVQAAWRRRLSGSAWWTCSRTAHRGCRYPRDHIFWIGILYLQEFAPRPSKNCGKQSFFGNNGPEYVLPSCGNPPTRLNMISVYNTSDFVLFARFVCFWRKKMAREPHFIRTENKYLGIVIKLVLCKHYSPHCRWIAMDIYPAETAR